jgi:hypothetical protein
MVEKGKRAQRGKEMLQDGGGGREDDASAQDCFKHWRVGDYCYERWRRGKGGGKCSDGGKGRSESVHKGMLQDGEKTDSLKIAKEGGKNE